jgi:hypothetical protein
MLLNDSFPRRRPTSFITVLSVYDAYMTWTKSRTQAVLVQTFKLYSSSKAQSIHHQSLRDPTNLAGQVHAVLFLIMISLDERLLYEIGIGYLQRGMERSVLSELTPSAVPPHLERWALSAEPPSLKNIHCARSIATRDRCFEDQAWKKSFTSDRFHPSRRIEGEKENFVKCLQGLSKLI